MSIEVADAAGLPVLTVRSLVTRPMTAEQLRAAVTTAAGGPDNGPLEVVWSPIPLDHKAIDRSGQLLVQSWEDFCAGDGGGLADGTARVTGRVVVWECECVR